jgi:hypothetical protein
VKLRHSLWATRKQWGEQAERWLATPLSQVPESDIDEALTRANKLLHALDRALPANKVCEYS